MYQRETIDQIRLHYRLSKAAERTRNQVQAGLVAFARTYLTAWRPGMEPKERKREADRAREVVMALLNGKDVPAGAEALAEQISGFVGDIAPAWAKFVERDKGNEKAARKLAGSLPAWARIGHVNGFSEWGLAVLVGEAGDIGSFSGCRKLYMRYGLAPDEAYPKGEKSEGRKIPRNTRGRIMGIIADPLFRAQWRGEKDGVPAHPIGPYGAVYAAAKASRLARIEAGEVDQKGRARKPIWAEKSARRAMVKALIHDVWCAWHGEPLMYATEEHAAIAAE